MYRQHLVRAIHLFPLAVNSYSLSFKPKNKAAEHLKSEIQEMVNGLDFTFREKNSVHNLDQATFNRTRRVKNETCFKVEQWREWQRRSVIDLLGEWKTNDAGWGMVVKICLGEKHFQIRLKNRPSTGNVKWETVMAGYRKVLHLMLSPEGQLQCCSLILEWAWLD